jgi:hypothetical protein
MFQGGIDQKYILPHRTPRSLDLRLLRLLVRQSFVNERQDTAASNRRLDEDVELFVSADGELKVTRCDTLDFEVARGVA